MIKRKLEWPESVLASKIISFFNNKQCGWLFMTMKCSISFFVFAFDLLRRGFLFRLTNSTIYNV